MDVLSQHELAELARRARWLAVSTVTASGAGHVGGPLSAMDLLINLFFTTLNVRPDEPSWPDRDFFILSKGHSAIGLYSVMALRGYFPVEELATFDKGDSRLQGHPDMTKLPGLDASTGSLGQGLSVGVGYALGARFKGKLNHTWVMVGDGEIQEGMIWEAVHVAARYRLGGLTLIVDCNGLQQYGWPHEVPASLDHRSHGDRRDPWAGTDLPAIFDAFGWNVTEFDGHDHVQIQQAYSMAGRRPHDAPPTVLLARTVKGKGVSFTEHSYKWHAQVPSAAELMQAGAELGFGTDQ